MSDQMNDGSQKSLTPNEAGYGNPPMRRRFKDCGNPNGRPKGSKNRKTIVKEVANAMHSVTENGKRLRRSTLELVLMRLRNLAIEGKNTRAFDVFHRLIKEYQQQDRNENLGVLLVQEPRTMEEEKAEAEKANAEAVAKRQAQLARRAQTPE